MVNINFLIKDILRSIGKIMNIKVYREKYEMAETIGTHETDKYMLVLDISSSESEKEKLSKVLKFKEERIKYHLENMLRGA